MKNTWWTLGLAAVAAFAVGCPAGDDGGTDDGATDTPGVDTSAGTPDTPSADTPIASGDCAAVCDSLIAARCHPAGDRSTCVAYCANIEAKAGGSANCSTTWTAYKTCLTGPLSDCAGSMKSWMVPDCIDAYAAAKTACGF